MVNKYELKVIDAVVKVQEMLLADGWEPAGETNSANYRIITKESYPLPGATICSGGKPRFKKNGWICAVGKRTVKFYMPLRNLGGDDIPMYMRPRQGNFLLPYDFWEWLGEPDPRDLEAVQDCMRKASFTGEERRKQFKDYVIITRAAIGVKEKKLETEKWPESRHYLEQDIVHLKLMLKAEEQIVASMEE